MGSEMQKRTRIGRRTLIVAAGAGLICGAYLLPRVAQAVTRRADPLSLRNAASSFLPPAPGQTLARSLRPLASQPLVVVPSKIRYRTPMKPAAPVFGYYRSGPPSGLSFY